MRYFISFLLLTVLGFSSCKGRHETTNEYRDAKTHASEEIGKAHKKAAKKARHDFATNQKKNKKSMEKKNKTFFKMKKRHL